MGAAAGREGGREGSGRRHRLHCAQPCKLPGQPEQNSSGPLLTWERAGARGREGQGPPGSQACGEGQCGRYRFAWERRRVLSS